MAAADGEGEGEGGRPGLSRNGGEGGGIISRDSELERKRGEMYR